MAKGEFNPGQGDVEITIGGERFILRYTMRALQVLQHKIGRERFGALLEGSEEIFTDFDVLEAMLMAGLRYHHGETPSVGSSDIMDALNLKGMSEISAKMGEAIAASFPAAPEGGPAGPLTPTAASPGSTSTS